MKTFIELSNLLRNIKFNILRQAEVRKLGGEKKIQSRIHAVLCRSNCRCLWSSFSYKNKTQSKHYQFTYIKTSNSTSPYFESKTLLSYTSLRID